MVTLVIGGSASGKSEYAENLTLKLDGRKKYIATMIPFDKECEDKIQKHRKMRENKGFATVECYSDLDKIQVDADVILLECVGNLLANEMYQGNDKVQDIDVVSKIMTAILHLKNNCDNLIIVSNDIFCDDMNLYEDSIEYINNLAKINRKIAEISSEVFELVYSIPIKLVN